MDTKEKIGGEKPAAEVKPVAEKVSVLVVDDESRNLDVVESILGPLDLRIVRAQTAEDALLALMHDEFACLILDVQMPSMSGLELAKLIKTRKRTQHIPIIFLTAYFLEEKDVLQGYVAGAVDYLIKPINPQILKSKVGVFVDLFRMAQALALVNTALETEVAQRKRAEEALQRLNSDLLETNSQLETLVFSIAHDFRGPLRAMEGCSRLLLDECGAALDENGREFANRINTSARFMDRLVLDLLEYGRAARAEITLGLVDPEKAWDAAVFQCQEQITEKDAIVETHAPFPAVTAHEGTLGQILSNLLTNALRFVRDGERPRIIFSAEQRGTNVRLWVEDNGIGIEPEHHNRIFRMFERLHGSSYGGTGIGLALVYKSVERMNGLVGVESKPGNGSRFWIELPGKGTD